jgi:hypothetical protein
MKSIHCLLVALLAGCWNATETAVEIDTHGDDQVTERDLADETFSAIFKRYGESMNPAKIPEEHRTVALVYHTHGIIGNGGFQYLFEGDFPGDPEFLLTRQAFKTIGATRASAAFEMAFAVFPKSTPPADIERRLEMWQAKYSLMDAIKNEQSPDAMYFAAMDETMQLLKTYIQANQDSFASLK